MIELGLLKRCRGVLKAAVKGAGDDGDILPDNFLKAFKQLDFSMNGRAERSGKHSYVKNHKQETATIESRIRKCIIHF